MTDEELMDLLFQLPSTVPRARVMYGGRAWRLVGVSCDAFERQWYLVRDRGRESARVPGFLITGIADSKRGTT